MVAKSPFWNWKEGGSAEENEKNNQLQKKIDRKENSAPRSPTSCREENESIQGFHHKRPDDSDDNGAGMPSPRTVGVR